MPNHLPAFLIKKIYKYVDELYLQQHMNYFDSKIKNRLMYKVRCYWIKNSPGVYDPWTNEDDVFYEEIWYLLELQHAYGPIIKKWRRLSIKLLVSMWYYGNIFYKLY